MACARMAHRVWPGTRVSLLISKAWIDGKGFPLHWRFDPDASRKRRDFADLVYEDRGTGLRLDWEWRASTEHGPIEHVIRIENRSRT